MPFFPRALAIALFLVSAVAAHAGGPTVGVVTKVVSPAQVGTETAIVGTLVHMRDELRTGANARLQITFRDKTELTLGENATVVVDRYVFDPDASTGEAVLNSTKGAFRLVTGSISDMTKKTISVSTPVATLGVRGTDLWGGPIDGQYGVLLVDNSRHHSTLLVHNDAGDVTLSKSGYGTDIDPLSKGKDNGAPGHPYQWPPDKIARALASTNVAGLGGGVGPALLVPLIVIPPAIPIIEQHNPPPRSP